MAASIARVLDLLELLQSSHLRHVAELAERLDVDERTVRRDVGRLIDLGVPVESLRGRYGGYRLAPGRRVLPLMFSSEEVVAVFLGLSRAQAASGEPSVAAQTALAKIKRGLPVADAERIDTLLGAMTRRTERRDLDPDAGVMLTLAEAVDRRQVLDLRYRNSEDVPSRRTVHPYGLVAHGHRWYLIAFDTDQNEERAFRVDRMRTVRSLPGTFAPPEGLDLAARLVERFVDADYRWHVVLRIRGTEDRIRAHLPPSVARLQRIGAEVDPPSAELPPWHRAEIHAQSLDWLPQVIVALDCDVLIDHPEELRDRVRTVATRMLAAASSTDQ